MANEWELHQVALARTAGFGLGMAVAGGIDSPYIPGEAAIIVSDVLRDGPAEGKLCVGDRLLSVNGVSLLDVTHSFAIKQLKLAGNSVDLVVHRRVKGALATSQGGARAGHFSNGSAIMPGSQKDIVLARRGTWEELGMNLGYRLFISGINDGSLAHREGLLTGDVIKAVNGIGTDHISLIDAINLISRRDEVRLTVERPPEGVLPDFRSTRPETQQQLKSSSGNLLGLQHNLQPAATSSRMELVRPRPWDYNPPPQSSAQPAVIRPTEGARARRISLRRDPTRSTGLRIIGGNASGIFVAAVEPGSPAEQVGLRQGDRLLSIGDTDTAGITKEEAALQLISQDSVVELVVSAAQNEYSRVSNGEFGDSLYIRVHFDYRGSAGGSTSGGGGSVSSTSSVNNGSYECGFRRGDVFHVVDTMHGGVVGNWRAIRVHPPPSPGEPQEVVIPNENRAYQLALTGGRSVPPQRQHSSFLRRKRSKSANPGSVRSSSDPPSASSGSSTSLAAWERAFFGAEGPSPDPFPPYERVVLRHPGFVRPLVLFGPLASEARQRLLSEMPQKFAAVEPPQQSEHSPRNVIKLSGIRAVIDSGRHALLDITPGAVQRLNFAQLAPIVLFLRPEGKPVLKELRTQVARFSGRAGKRALEEAASMEALAGHLFTGTVPLRLQTGGRVLSDWFTRLGEVVQHQQREPTWMTVEASVGTGRAGGGSKRPTGADFDADISLRAPNQWLDVSRLSAPNLLDRETPALDGPTLGLPEGTLTRSVSDPHLLSPPKAPSAVNGWDAGYISDDRYQPATVGRSRGRGFGQTPMAFRAGLETANRSARPFQSSSALPTQPLENGILHDVDVDPYAINTLPGKRSVVMPHNSVGGGDGYATVKKPLGIVPKAVSSSQHGLAHDTYRYVRSSAMAASGRATEAVAPPKPPAPAVSSFGQPFGVNAQMRLTPQHQQHQQSLGQHTQYQQTQGQHTQHQQSIFTSSAQLRMQQPLKTSPMNRSPNSRAPVNNRLEVPGARSPASSEGPSVGERQVVAEASGLFDDRGGVLEVREHSVSLRIPPGALPSGTKQEVYFKIYKEGGVSLPGMAKDSVDAGDSGASAHSGSGATLVSPLVMCGPHGLRFQRAVELRMPHRPDLKPDTWQFSLLHSSSDSDQPGRWRETRVGAGPTSDSNGPARLPSGATPRVLDNGQISVLVDHF